MTDMGYNSVLLVLNDRLSEIEKDPDFGKKVVNAIREHAGRPSHFATVWPSQTLVIGQAHADDAQVLVVAANQGHLLGMGHWKDSDELLLSKLAYQHGYALLPLERRKT